MTNRQVAPSFDSLSQLAADVIAHLDRLADRIDRAGGQNPSLARVRQLIPELKNYLQSMVDIIAGNEDEERARKNVARSQ
jgi:hypothetical protein